MCSSDLFATGQLLAYNNVHLSEGEWNPAAYEESMERAWARSHGIPNKLLHEEPAVFALPGYTPKVDLDAGANPFGNDNHTPESDAAPLLVPQPEGERQLPDDDSTSLVEPSATAALNDVAPIAASAGASSQALLPLPENLPEVRTSSRPAVTDIPLLQPAPFNDIE